MTDTKATPVEEGRPSLLRWAMGAVGASRTPPSQPKLPIISKILLSLGALTVYNVATHYQALIDLSASIHWIAGWWRYFVSIPFMWLHIPLTAAQREVCAVLLFFTGAANVAIYRWRKVPLHKHWFEKLKDAFYLQEDDFGPETRPQTLRQHIARALVSMVLLMGLFLAVMFVLVGLVRFDILIAMTIWAGLAFIPVVLWWLLAYFKFSGYEDWLTAVIRVMFFPFRAFGVWAQTLIVFRREIVRSCWLLLILLALDVGLRYTLDPLLKAFPTLPEPPKLNDRH